MLNKELLVSSNNFGAPIELTVGHFKSGSLLPNEFYGYSKAGGGGTGGLSKIPVYGGVEVVALHYNTVANVTGIGGTDVQAMRPPLPLPIDKITLTVNGVSKVLTISTDTGIHSCSGDPFGLRSLLNQTITVYLDPPPTGFL